MRTDEINKSIDQHFKSNNGNWMVESYANPEMSNWLQLSRDYRRENKIDARWVALHIFRKFPSVTTVCCENWIFTPYSLRAAGFKI